MKQFQFINNKNFKYVRNLGDFTNSFNQKIKNTNISVNWVLI